MFNGIIRYLGKIAYIYDRNKFIISSSISNIKEGNSLSCNGACLTVTGFEQDKFSVYLSDETLSCTNFSSAKVGDWINIEEALKFGDSIDGHLISGHIDTTLKISLKENAENSYLLKFYLPDEYKKFISKKSSVAINGVSLTVTDVEQNFFSVNIIPYTFKNTNIQYLNTDSLVNLEVDIFARYINKILELRDQN